eukprot:1145949-Pelagomonas_calceolata.AAC.1
MKVVLRKRPNKVFNVANLAVSLSRCTTRSLQQFSVPPLTTLTPMTCPRSTLTKTTNRCPVPNSPNRQIAALFHTRQNDKLLPCSTLTKTTHRCPVPHSPFEDPLAATYGNGIRQWLMPGPLNKPDIPTLSNMSILSFLHSPVEGLRVAGQGNEARGERLVIIN